MSIFKKNNGITLLALIILIIILTLLAGVSINAIFGSNGILNNAKGIAERSNKQIADEDAAMNQVKNEVSSRKKQNEELLQNIQNSSTDLETSITINIETNKLDNYEYGLGETIEYSVQITNDGNSALSDVVVRSELTSNNWNIDYIEPGETITLTPSSSYYVTEADILAREVVNGITATVDGENYSETLTSMLEAPNGLLSTVIVATSSPQSAEGYATGETITCGSTIANDGNLTITNIVVRCELTNDTWNIGTLAPGEVRTLTPSPYYRVTESDILEGEVQFVITAEGMSPDPDNPEVIASKEQSFLTENLNAHLSVSFAPTADVKVGEDIIYVFTVTNDGNLTINDISITSELTGDAWNIATLAPGADIVREASYTAVSAGSITCDITVTGTSPDPDNPEIEVTAYTTSTISKIPSTISASSRSKSITQGKDAIITATVPKNATGRVVVTLNENTEVKYYADVVNGKAQIIISNLSVGKYTAYVTYEGDDKYLPDTKTTDFSVTKIKSPTN